ncbi:alpha/beta fold hydrolase [Microlunatus endophyticus]
MECAIDGVLVHYAEHGAGTALVVLHGAGVDHREVEAAVEEIVPGEGLRRIYPDLPGMGRTRGTDGLSDNDDVVRLLVRFIERLAPGGALVLGHSYGAYLARGLAARRPDLVLGLGLHCPIGDSAGDVPEPSAVRTDPDAYDGLDAKLRSGFEEYFVIRTVRTARRYRDQVVPGNALADEEVLGRIFSGWRIDLGTEPFAGPTLIVAGRRDSTAGFAGVSELFRQYPMATLAILEDAGHALAHEQPEQLSALVSHWIRRSTVR